MKSTTLLTAEEFARVAPVLGPCELVKGEIVYMAPGGINHSEVTTNIVFLLARYARQKKMGRVLSNEAGIVVEKEPATVRGADVLYISHKRLPKDRKWSGFLRQAPELVVEVLGEDNAWSEMEKKVAEYHTLGVDMVWVADPHTLSVRLCPRGKAPGVLHGAEEIGGGNLLPGFRCKVAEFFSH